MAAVAALATFGWTVYRWRCPPDLFERGYRADVGISSSSVAGEAAAVRRLSQLLRCCPKVKSYAVDFEVAGTQSGRSAVVYEPNGQGPGRLGFESGLSGLQAPAFLATVEDIQRLARTGASLRGLPLE
jgi:hypothetical protein